MRKNIILYTFTCKWQARYFRLLSATFMLYVLYLAQSWDVANHYRIPEWCIGILIGINVFLLIFTTIKERKC